MLCLTVRFRFLYTPRCLAYISWGNASPLVSQSRTAVTKLYGFTSRYLEPPVNSGTFASACIVAFMLGGHNINVCIYQSSPGSIRAVRFAGATPEYGHTRHYVLYVLYIWVLVFEPWPIRSVRGPRRVV